MIELNALFLEKFENTLLSLKNSLQAFNQFLSEEKILLDNQKFAEMEEFLKLKQSFIHDVQVNMDALKACLSSSNPINNVNAIMGLYEPLKRQEMTALWVEVKKLLEECDQKNLLNGMLISTMKNVKNVIERLMSNFTNKEPN